MLYIREVLVRKVPLVKMAESLAILVQTDVYECEMKAKSCQKPD